MIINKIKVHVSIANDHGPWCIYMKKLRYFHLKMKRNLLHRAVVRRRKTKIPKIQLDFTTIFLNF